MKIGEPAQGFEHRHITPWLDFLPKRLNLQPLTPKPTVDDIDTALPIIRNIYHNSHSLGSVR